ncbi:MAG: hypothetical protein GKR97_01630 [Rhizobiaceae bacterium]|nr:hypothetical protein [Rhizobiaceae bacterium]
MKQSLRKSHSTIWKVLMVLIPAIIVTAVIVRQDAADLEAPVQIAPPSAQSTESGS